MPVKSLTVKASTYSIITTLTIGISCANFITGDILSERRRESVDAGIDIDIRHFNYLQNLRGVPIFLR